MPEEGYCLTDAHSIQNIWWKIPLKRNQHEGCGQGDTSQGKKLKRSVKTLEGITLKCKLCLSGWTNRTRDVSHDEQLLELRSFSVQPKRCRAPFQLCLGRGLGPLLDRSCSSHSIILNLKSAMRTQLLQCDSECSLNHKYIQLPLL